MNNRYKLGLFVTISIFLLIIITAVLGMYDGFKEKAYLYTTVTESVQGLAIGSKVKYLGVPIGEVSNIVIDQKGKLIIIYMEIDLERFRDNDGRDQVDDDDFYNVMSQDIKNGLRCKMEMEGITGGKYIELDYADNVLLTKNEKEKIVTVENELYVPSMPSVINNIRESVVSILKKLEGIDYAGIVAHMERTMNSADQLLSDPKIKSILSNLEQSSQQISHLTKSVEEGLSPDQLRKLSKKVEDSIDQVNKLTSFVEGQIRDAEVKKVSADFRATFQTLQDTARSLNETMAKIKDGLDAVVGLVQTLDDDPASLIRGKQKNKMAEELYEKQ